MIVLYANLFEAKNFLSLHPSSVVASHPEWVQGVEDYIRKGTALYITLDNVVYTYRLLDDKTVEDALYHQLLCYLQLLETTKPFIVNITRVPGKIIILILSTENINVNIPLFRHTCIVAFWQSQ